MPSIDDPTKTLMIRRAWIREFNVRYNKLKGDINRFIPGWFARHARPITVNQNFEFTSGIQATAEFLLWLELQINNRIYDNITSPIGIWQNQYITRAYERGVRIARIELRKQGIRDLSFLSQFTPAPVIGTATSTLGAGAVVGPIHLDAIQLLYARDFSDLQGITSAMSQQIARVLTGGIEQGLGATQLAKNINDRVDKIGITRSRLLARTETVRAYNVANINEAGIIGEDTNTDIKQEWVTAGDERVRSTHAQRNRVIYEPEVARTLIGEPNCRCSLVPFIEKLDNAEDKKERSEARKSGLSLINE